MSSILFLIMTAAAAHSGEAPPSPKPSARHATVKVSWKYHDVPGKLEIYEPAYDGRVWEMGSRDSLSQLPVKEKITDSTVRVPVGEHKTFVLVLKNETRESLYFFAAPHSVDPVPYSLGFRFKCLCVNHVFSVKPGKIWYRIVEMTLNESFRGDKLEVTHDLIRVDEATRKKMHSAPQHQHQDSH